MGAKTLDQQRDRSHASSMRHFGDHAHVARICGHMQQSIAVRLPSSVLITDHLLAISTGMQRLLSILSVCSSASCAKPNFRAVPATVAVCSLFSLLQLYVAIHRLEAFVGSSSVLAQD